MQVSVQKSTRTTRPRSAAGSSGSELSHAVPAPNEGMCTRPNRAVMTAPRSSWVSLSGPGPPKARPPLQQVAPVEDPGLSPRGDGDVLRGHAGCAIAAGRLAAGDG